MYVINAGRRSQLPAGKPVQPSDSASRRYTISQKRKIAFLKPTEVGFVCIVAISNRRG
jgi:hypothetical protein